MEPLIRLHEYCETALMEALSTARLLPVPEAGHSLPKLRTLTSAALRFANVGAHPRTVSGSWVLRNRCQPPKGGSSTDYRPWNPAKGIDGSNKGLDTAMENPYPVAMITTGIRHGNAARSFYFGFYFGL